MEPRELYYLAISSVLLKFLFRDKSLGKLLRLNLNLEFCLSLLTCCDYRYAPLYLVAVPFYITTSNGEGFHFSPHPHQYLLSFFFFCHPNECEVVSPCHFDNRIFLVADDIAHLFIYLFSMCIYSLEKNLFRSLGHFLNWVTCL